MPPRSENVLISIPTENNNVINSTYTDVLSGGKDVAVTSYCTGGASGGKDITATFTPTGMPSGGKDAVVTSTPTGVHFGGKDITVTSTSTCIPFVPFGYCSHLYPYWCAFWRQECCDLHP